MVVESESCLHVVYTERLSTRSNSPLAAYRVYIKIQLIWRFFDGTLIDRKKQEQTRTTSLHFKQKHGDNFRSVDCVNYKNLRQRQEAFAQVENMLNKVYVCIKLAA